MYPESRRIAGHYMQQERPGHTLRTTGLLDEVYLRLFGAAQLDWQNRAHFCAVAREIAYPRGACEGAEREETPRRECGRDVVSEVDAAAPAREEDLVALDEALSRLERIGRARVSSSSSDSLPASDLH